MIHAVPWIIQANKCDFITTSVCVYICGPVYLHITKYLLPPAMFAPGKFPIAVNAGSAATYLATCLILAAQYGASK